MKILVSSIPSQWWLVIVVVSAAASALLYVLYFSAWALLPLLLDLVLLGASCFCIGLSRACAVGR